MADYKKQLKSLIPIILTTISKTKNQSDIPYLTKIVEEVYNKSPEKNINKFMVRDAIIYTYSEGKISINQSGKQLILDTIN